MNITIRTTDNKPYAFCQRGFNSFRINSQKHNFKIKDNCKLSLQLRTKSVITCTIHFTGLGMDEDAGRDKVIRRQRLSLEQAEERNVKRGL